MRIITQTVARIIARTDPNIVDGRHERACGHTPFLEERCRSLHSLNVRLTRNFVRVWCQTFGQAFGGRSTYRIVDLNIYDTSTRCGASVPRFTPVLSSNQYVLWCCSAQCCRSPCIFPWFPSLRARGVCWRPPPTMTLFVGKRTALPPSLDPSLCAPQSKNIGKS